jgi:hypothetical protein
MRPPETTRHKIAVVRVEVRDQPTRDLLIELLEVGREPQSDRLLGSTTGISDACRMLAVWLEGLSGTTSGDTGRTDASGTTS